MMRLSSFGARAAALGLCLVAAGCDFRERDLFSMDMSGAQAGRTPGLSLSGARSGAIGETNARHRGSSQRLFHGGVRLSQAPVEDPSGGPMLSLNFSETPVAEAARELITGVLGQPVTVDPGITGTVTLASQGDVSAGTALEAFELALQQNGAALIERTNGYEIVPLSGDIALSTTVGRPVRPGLAMRVVPLRFIAAEEMAAILRPTAGDAIVGVDATRNYLVLAGVARDQRLWLQTIDTFDVDWLANRSVGMFSIRQQSAQSVLTGLEEIFTTDDSSTPVVEFQLMPEQNSILAVAATPDALDAAAQWVERLTSKNGNAPNIYIYEMKYAQAAEALPILANLTGAEVAASTEEMEGDGETQMADGARPRIAIDPSSNALFIRSSAQAYQEILATLHAFDVAPRQVLVEATVVEVAMTDDLRFGVQYFLQEGRGRLLLSAGNSGNIAPSLPGFAAVAGAPANIVVNALESVTRVQVVSSPNLMVLNNETARLVVGDQVPVTERVTQDNGNSDLISVNSVSFRDVGVVFEVTPRISAGGNVLLDISQQVSRLRPGTNDLTPTISQREVSSQIAVANGETIVLGGLFSQEGNTTQDGLPYLRDDIPLLHKLFGTSNRRSARNELLVLITPSVVDSAAGAALLTSDLRARVNRMGNR